MNQQKPSNNDPNKNISDIATDMEVLSRLINKISGAFTLLSEQWYFIAKRMVMLAIVTAVLLLLIPSSFQSTALVGIFPPQFASEVQEKPLTVMTAKEILTSQELVQNIITNMQKGREVLDQLTKRKPVEAALKMITTGKEEDIANEVEFADKQTIQYLKYLSTSELQGLLKWDKEELSLLTADELSKKLDCEEIEEKKTAIDIIYSPLIRLLAVGSDGNSAMLLANTWAYLFEQKYTELTSEKQNSMVRFLEEQQNNSQIELEDIETSIVKVKAKNNINLYKTQIASYTSAASSWTEELLKKRNEFMAQAKILQMTARQRNMLTSGTAYLGAIDSLKWQDRNVDTLISLDVPKIELNEILEELPLINDKISSDSILNQDKLLFDNGLSLKDNANLEESLFGIFQQQTMAARGNREKNMVDIQNFQRKYPLEMMEMDLNNRQKEVMDMQIKLNAEQVNLNASLKTLENVEKSLAETSRSIFLLSGVPQEAVVLTETIGNPTKLDKFSNFYNEQLNPVWKDLIDRRSTLNKDVEQYRSNIEEISRVLPEREANLENLAVEVRKVRELNKVFGENLDKWNKTSDQYYTDFMRMNLAITNTSERLLSLYMEIEQLSSDRSFALKMSDAIQETLDEAQMQISLLEVRKGVLQKKVDLLLNKYHQALIAERKNVKDVSFAGRAIAPTKHFFPPRSIFFTIIMIFGFFALCLTALNRSIQQRRTLLQETETMAER